MSEPSVSYLQGRSQIIGLKGLGANSFELEGVSSKGFGAIIRHAVANNHSGQQVPLDF
jgi:hypothetical protein